MTKDVFVDLVRDAVNGLLDVLGIGSPVTATCRIGVGSGEGFARDTTPDSTWFATVCTNRRSEAVVLDRCFPESDIPITAVSSVIGNHTIDGRPDQSQRAIPAAAASRQLSYVIHIGST